jgi:hypothetical protein
MMREMTASTPLRALARGLLPIALLAGSVVAQDPASPPGNAPGPRGNAPRVDREAMWFAPTAEDWKKPCLVEFQRSFEDAVAVARETGKAILVCVNMDGEIASEHYAGVRYRQPEIAKLYEPYVCVIASVYRHTPRDHDDEGERILCPRFGSVTCGEHIAIEPVLYEKFFDGTRVAPRHIMVELDGKETYDVFYAFDTESVFAAIRDGIANREDAPPPVVRGDRTLIDRVASRDATDRRTVEQAYRESDAATRRALLDAALANPDAAPVDLLRLAVFGLDPDLAAKAREALARSTTDAAVPLIHQALRVPMPEPEREKLVATLESIGAESPRARTLAAVHRGLAKRSSSIDLEKWAAALDDGAATRAAYRPAIDAALAAQSTLATSQDPIQQLELAEAMIERAAEPTVGELETRALHLDAAAATAKARELGASGWRLDALSAATALAAGDAAAAREHAVAAMAAMPPDAASMTSLIVVALFAEQRRDAIVAAIRGKQEWPQEWLADAHAAYTILVRHPFANDRQLAAHYDFLRWVGGAERAAKVLDESLARFPDSTALHARLRDRVLRERGVADLEPLYARMLAARDAALELSWFAGYASLTAAEIHRRGGDVAAATAAYDRAIGRFETSIARLESSRYSSNTMISLCLAGKSRLALENGDLKRAVADLLAALERQPDAGATRDGLNISPVDTAKMLRAKLVAEKQDELAAQVDVALAALDPALLELPEYERGGGGG